MKEVVELESSPVDEPCAQVGAENYGIIAYRECTVYKEQLKRVYVAARGELPKGFTLFIKTTNHEFGERHEVAAKFDSKDRACLDAAFWLQDNLPLKWDAEARNQLRE
jgi:hypothetical protein